MKIKKLVFVVGFILVCLIGTLFVSFGNSKTPALDLAKLQNDNGGYVYPGITWNMSVEELEKSLGYKLDNPQFGSEQQPFDYRTNTDYQFAIFSPKGQDKYVELFNNYGQISYQFEYGKLKSIQLTFMNNVDKMKNNNLKELSVKIKDKLIELYDENYKLDESSKNKESKLDVTTYTWEHKENKKSVTRVFVSTIPSSGEINTVSLGVSYFTNKD